MPARPRLSALKMRDVRFEDVPEVLRLVQRAVARGCRDHYDRAQMAAVHATYAQTLFVEALGSFQNVVALQTGRIIGFAQLDPASTKLRALFVDASSQRRGVGRELLAEIEARALRRGCVRLHGAMSLNAIPFYARAGFLPCAGPELLQTAGVPVPIVRMEKHLR